MTEPWQRLPALSLKQLQYFVTLAELRHFTDTANRLAISQPALSSALRQIETVLGGKLVNRTASSVTLTELGAAILPHARRVLSVAQLAFHDMEQIVAAGGDGTVRIGLVPSVSSLLFPLLPQVLAQTFPGCGSSFTIRPMMRWCVSCKAGRLISVSAPSTARYPPRYRSTRCVKIRLWRCCTVTIRWQTSRICRGNFSPDAILRCSRKGIFSDWLARWRKAIV
jgi:DNA-binding CsgD family transcriptional regulator